MTTAQQNTKSDHQVREAILGELAWMPDIEADRIGVAINDGAVTLSGQVLTYPEKHAAVRAAFRVRGVTAVADEIEVHNTWAPRADTDIAREAGEVLERTRTAPAGSVKVEVHDGFIGLTGTVTWEYERAAIKNQMAMLSGVHGVGNHITLKPKAHVSPLVAKTKIADALRRNASIEADRITVQLDGDKIILNGSVATFAERKQAGHAAWATPGVTSLENNLRVTR